MMLNTIGRLLLACLLWPLSALAAPALDDFLRHDRFDAMSLSPSGEYIAATVPLDGRNAIVTLRLSDMTVLAQLGMPENTYVNRIRWASDARLLFDVTKKFGQLEEPLPSGEIFAMDVDGKRAGALAGYAALDKEKTFTRIKQASQRVHAWLIDAAPVADDQVLVATLPWGNTMHPQVERMDARSGKRSPALATAPMPHGARFFTDPKGEIRFVIGWDSDNRVKTHLRHDRGDDWQLLNDPNQSGVTMIPVGFNADASIAYLQISETAGPDALYAYSIADGSKQRVLADEVVSPAGYLFSPTDQSLYGVIFLGATPRVAYPDPNHPFARLHASMAKNFPEQLVEPVSFSRDGNLALFLVRSDRNPGDYFLLDRVNKKANLVASRAQWLDPEQLAPTRAVTIAARDGLTLHGFLTLPAGTEAKNLPLIVNPHGGPFGIFDDSLYDNERQLLASRGYAVLQVNFRGSGNYGQAFEEAGYRQWGGQMQDDLTDATRWAIEQGIADSKRICIYGASYGGYAAVMGAAKEPDLYRCVAGNVGVYDMAAMHKSGDIARERWGRNFLKEVLGVDELAAISPNQQAERIKATVFLAAGGRDERAPKQHTEDLRDALKRAGGKVEAVIYADEGHGYFLEENRRDYYTRLLAFFDRHLGAKAASTSQ